MTSYALAIFLALAATSFAQDPATDPNYRGDSDPLGSVSTSKLQIHVSIIVDKNVCFENFVVKMTGCIIVLWICSCT